jgi:3-hydroxybutyrate dehydrogenase
MTLLSGKRALVTGSLQGIGLNIATALAKEGCHLVLHGLGDQTLQEKAIDTVQQAGAASALAFTHDISNEEQVLALAQSAQEQGPIDILVNNAGIQRTAALADMANTDWNAIIAINLSAAFLTMKAIMPGMAERGYGRVINIASVHGLVASMNKAPYVAAKFGLVGLTKVAALEYARAGTREQGGVTANCICPGWTETDILEPQIAARARQLNADRTTAIQDLLREKQPTQRMSHPSEIGQFAAWLCHPVAHNITGAAIPIEGGWTSQ